MGRVGVALVLVAAAGCGRGGLFPPRFRDDAPANATVPAGEMPTRFTDPAGGPADLAAYRGKSAVLLVVLRGMPRGYDGRPCPYCLAQVGGLAANYPEFRARGAEVVAVFPGSAAQGRDFVGGVTDAPDLPFPILLDPDLAACDRLGIRGDLAKPSTFVLDKTGAVVYAYVGQTYSDRPSVKAQLDVLDGLNRTAPPPGPPPGRD